MVDGGEDVRGLCCQGGTLEELADAVFALAPDLLVANGEATAGEQVEIVLTAEQRKTIEAVAAYMATLYRALVDILREAGCRLERQGKGSHEIWYSPTSQQTFTVTGQHRRQTAGECDPETGGIAEGLLIGGSL